MAHELLQALVLFLPLFGIKWVASNGEKPTKRTNVCLEDFLDLFLPRLLFFEPVHPVAMTLILNLQFVSDYPPCQFARRHCERLGI